MNWLKTPLDWIALGCLLANLLAVVVVMAFLLPVARESNRTLIKISTQVDAQTSALVTSTAAIKALLEKQEEHE